MWTNQDAQYNAEAQEAQATVDTLYEERGQVQNQQWLIQEAAEQEARLAAQAFIERYNAKHAATVASIDRQVADTYAAYCAATNTAQAMHHRMHTATQSFRTRARTKALAPHILELDTLRTREADVSLALEQAKRRVQSLRYREGLHQPSPENNDGECIIAPNGDTYMVPQYEDHGNVYDAVWQKYGASSDPSEWIRIETTGRATNAYKQSISAGDLSSFSTETLNAVADYMDMLRETAETSEDTYLQADYAQRIERLSRKFNVAPEE